MWQRGGRYTVVTLLHDLCYWPHHLKNGQLGFFLIYFCVFKHTLQFFQQINVKKCPSSLRCWDSNSQPLEHESPSITTRPRPPAMASPHLCLMFLHRHRVLSTKFLYKFTNVYRMSSA